MGGAAGHLSHLHEDLNITFGDIKNVLQNVASADIDAYEKVDGQNILFTYDVPSASLRTARNAGDLKRGGMSPEEYASKWKGHPAESAFVDGFDAINAAIAKLPENKLQTIFGKHGENFINAEIMYVGNPNIIQYGANWIVLHDLSGPTAKEENFNSLVSLINSAEISLDKSNWTVSGPKLAAIHDISEEKHYENFVAKLDSINSLGDSATLADFVESHLRNNTLKGTDIPESKVNKLIDIILSKEDAPKLITIKKGSSKEAQKLMSSLATQQNKYKLISRIVAPIENAINNFAIEVLRGMKSFFVNEHDKELQRMRSELQTSIEVLTQVNSSDSEAISLMLDKQLSKLGKIENVASTLEGIVFEYPPGSKKLYKLTGAFAMTNQIIGKARRTSQQNNEALIRSYISSILLT